MYEHFIVLLFYSPLFFKIHEIVQTSVINKFTKFKVGGSNSFLRKWYLSIDTFTFLKFIGSPKGTR